MPSSSITTGFTPEGALLDKDPPKEMQRTSNSLSSSCKGTRSLTDSGTPAELPPGCHEHPSKTADLQPRQGLEPPSPLPWRKGSLPRRGLVVVVYIVDSTIRQLPLFPPARKINHEAGDTCWHQEHPESCPWWVREPSPSHPWHSNLYWTGLHGSCWAS